MAADLDRWQLHHNLRTLVVEVVDDPTAPVVLSGRHTEIELTEHELEWILSASGPAALAMVRRRRPRTEVLP